MWALVTVTEEDNTTASPDRTACSLPPPAGDRTTRGTPGGERAEAAKVCPPGSCRGALCSTLGQSLSQEAAGVGRDRRRARPCCTAQLRARGYEDARRRPGASPGRRGTGRLAAGNAQRPLCQAALDGTLCR